jgi:small subunit ribosomal protein S26e
LEKRGDLQRREDDATFCVHLFPSKLTRAIFFHPHSTQVKRVFCESSGALVPKDKAVKRFIVRNMVESAAIRDLQEACAYETYTLPKMYRKVHYSISAAIHSKVVRVRSREARRIREPPRRAPRKQEK